MTWRPNERGVCPPEAKGRRVQVRLRNGIEDGAQPIASGGATGWAADRATSGRAPPADWSLNGHPFDIVEWDFP